MTPKTVQRQVQISGHEFGLPYSKGLMASRIMATGLAPARAFHVAEVVEQRLLAATTAVTADHLDRMVLEVLAADVGDHYASSFAKWLRVAKLDRPLVVLVGGATGVGKSTVATLLAGRLGVTRVIPTDAVREVMRAMFSREIMPTIHTSSFDAARLVRRPLPRNADPVLIGFGEQASAVAVGVEALITRAAAEGTDLILEGAHLVPGFIDRDRLAEQVVVVSLVVTLDDEEQHRARFRARGLDARTRPAERYLDHFDDIRRQQQYITSLAVEHGVPIVASNDLDTTLGQVIDLVFTQAVGAVPDPAVPATATSKRGAP